jgi:hypothetical protein
MAKPNQKAIEEALAAWEKSVRKARKIEAERDAALSPLTAAYDKKCAPIYAAANENLAPLVARMTALTAEIRKQLNLGIDVDAKTVALSQVTAGKAIAEVQTGEGNREISPEKFFDQTPPAQRDARFWDCVKIGIAKAEKFLGKAMDSVAKKPWAASIVIKLKD